jgi:AAA domain
MAFGRNFLHWRSRRKARVLYVDGEMPRDLMKERLEVMCKIFALKPDEIARSKWLTVLSSEDFEDMLPLNTEGGQKWLDDFIARTGPYDFIVFDNITSLCSGIMKEEESWQMVKPYTLELTKRRMGQLWVHHTGHDTTRGYGTKTREWQMDTVMTAEQVSKDHIDFNLLFTKKRRSKPSNYEDFKDVHLELVDGAWRTEAVVVKAKGRPNESERIALKALQASGGNLTENEWREYSYDLGISASSDKAARRKAFTRARDGLVEKGLVKCVEDRWGVS